MSQSTTNNEDDFNSELKNLLGRVVSMNNSSSSSTSFISESKKIEGKSFSEIVRSIADNISLFSDLEIKRIIIPYIILSSSSYKKKKSSSNNNFVERFCFLIDYILSHKHFPIIIHNLLVPMMEENDFYKSLVKCCLNAYGNSREINSLSSGSTSGNIEQETIIRIISTLHEKISALYFTNDERKREDNVSSSAGAGATIRNEKSSLIVELLDQAASTTSSDEDSFIFKSELSTRSQYTRTNSSLWKLPKLFNSDIYVSHIINSLVSITGDEEIVNNYSTDVASILIFQFIKRGYGDNCCDIFVKWWFSESNSQTLYHILSSLENKKGFNIGALEAIIKSFLVKVLTKGGGKPTTMDRYAELVKFFSDRIVKSFLWYELFTNALIFKYAFAPHVVNKKDFIFVKMLVDSIGPACTNSSISLSSVTDYISSIWKQHYFIMQSNEEQQLYVSYCLAMFISIMTKEEFEISQTLKNCIEGIQQRLHSSVDYVRKSGCLLSLQMSKSINPKQPPLVLFDEYKDCLDDLITNISSSSNKFSERRAQNSPLLGLGTDESSSNGYSKKEFLEKKKKEKVFNPNQLLLDDDDDESSSEDGAEEEEKLSDTSSVESLESLDMSDEGENDSENNPYKPYYIKDVIDFLFANDQDKDQMFKIEAALKYSTTIIEKSDPKVVQLNGVNLCTALLTCSESTIDNYFTDRMNAMVALLTKTCSSVIELQFDKIDQRSIDFEDETVLLYLTNKFWSNQVTQAQRIDILTVLVKTALNLSNNNLEKKENMPSTTTDSSTTTNEQDSSKKSSYTPQYPSNTRRWGSSLQTTNKKKTTAKANYFLLHAYRFYYMLLRTKNQMSETIHIMFGEDSLVLSKIIHTIGIFIYCCGSNPSPLVGQDLAKNTIEFLWTLILHSKDVQKINSLRASILNTLHTSFCSCTSTTLLSDIQVDVQLVFDWLMNISENDGSNDCRELSKMALASLSSKISK